MDHSKKRALSRLLTGLDHLEPSEPLPQIEDAQPIGTGFRIGITGPLGAGKSSLINQIVLHIRRLDKTVGVIAVDPSSPFTGGAVLGDRVRMVELAGDEGVFIRSLASRGMSGGLTANAEDAADLFDCFGFERIIIETVGVGQTEVDIMSACDCVIVVLEPSSGDGIQAIKAGLMEIADLFVVNKKDMRGADRFIQDLQSSIELRDHVRLTQIIPTEARTGEGTAEVVQWLEQYWATATDRITARRLEQRQTRIKRMVEKAVVKNIWNYIPIGDVKLYAAQEGYPVRTAVHSLVNGFFNRLEQLKTKTN